MTFKISPLYIPRTTLRRSYKAFCKCGDICYVYDKYRKGAICRTCRRLNNTIQNKYGTD